MTKHQKIFLIHTFRDAIFANTQKIIVPDYQIPDTFEIDRFLLKDICHLLNQYESEIINNEIQ